MFMFIDHKLNIRNQETKISASAKHFWENDYTFNFDSVKIISRPNSIFEPDFLEAFHIHKNHNNVAKYDFAMPCLSDYWKSYIKIVSTGSSFFFRL